VQAGLKSLGLKEGASAQQMDEIEKRKALFKKIKESD